jgi:hypothetical protein
LSNVCACPHPRCLKHQRPKQRTLRMRGYTKSGKSEAMAG